MLSGALVLRLASAVALCLCRRVHPVVLVAATAALVLVTVAAHRAGLVGAALLGGVLGDFGIARSLVLASAVPCLTAGAALGATFGPRSALGAQVVSGPVGTVTLRVATLGPPLTLVALAAGPPVLAGVVPVALASPGRLAAGIAVVAVLWSAFAAGGAVAGWFRTHRRGAAVCAAGALGAFGASVEAATRSLGGATWAMPVTLALVVVTSAAWLAVAGEGEPPQRVGLRRRTRLGLGRLDGSPERAVAAALALLLVRRFELRVALLAAVAGGLVGGGVARIGGADASTGAMLAACGAVLAAAPAALAVGGAVADGAWFWRRAPVGASRTAPALAVGAASVSWPALAAALALAVAVGPRHGGPGVEAAGLLVVGWACALGAGAVAPWRRVGATAQGASLSVLALLVGVVAAALPRLGEGLLSVGAPPAVVGAVLVALPLSAGTALLARALR